MYDRIACFLSHWLVDEVNNQPKSLQIGWIFAANQHYLTLAFVEERNQRPMHASSVRGFGFCGCFKEFLNSNFECCENNDRVVVTNKYDFFLLSASLVSFISFWYNLES